MPSPSELRALLTSPCHIGATCHQQASEQEAVVLSEMNDHFGRAGFALPTTEGSSETAALTEREMMFLVRLLSGPSTVDAEKQSRETLMRCV